MKSAVVVLLLAATPAAAEDYAYVKDIPEVQEGMITLAMAYYIGETCPTISGRRIKGGLFLLHLANVARGFGFSDDEIRAYAEDKVEKARLEAIARERFITLGGVEGEPATFCAIGEAEMAAGSEIGRLLW